MKSRKHLIIIGTIFVFGAGLLSVGNGCSKSMTSAINMSSTAPGGSSANGGSGTTVPDTPAAPVIPDAKTVSLVYSKQVVDQLSSCVGVAKVSDKTIAMYDQKKGAISVYGSANTVTSPMMMAVASIAGEICNDLIDQEVSSGARMFVGFDENIL